jgi:tRNA G18 (ribose-2'-O)-methylase SpoU
VVEPVDLIEVEDPADPRLADFLELRDGAGTLQARHGTFICEGMVLVERVLQSDVRVRSVLTTPRKLARLAAADVSHEVPVYLISQDHMNETVGYDFHRGVVASALRRPSRTVDELLQSARVVAVLEGVSDAENVGAIFRSAWALGIDAILLDGQSADPYYRRAVRVSMGATFMLPFAALEKAMDSVEGVKRAGYVSVALTPDPAAIPLDQLELSPDAPVAVFLGSEGSGLTTAVLEAVDHRVRIPMVPGSDSLNVGHAAAVAFSRLGVT